MAIFNKDTDGLILEKCSTGISDEEKEIGMKDSVRKGKDLEDLILDKFAKVHKCEKPIKPQHMYQITSAPFLTVNFDGVMREDGYLIPVECKFVTTYGNKHYNPLYAYEREYGETVPPPPAMYIHNSALDACQVISATRGIPAYYFAQLQQQMLALEAPYGYLTALHDKGWELCIYKVMRNEMVQTEIIKLGYKAWTKIEAIKGKQNVTSCANTNISPNEY